MFFTKVNEHCPESMVKKVRLTQLTLAQSPLSPFFPFPCDLHVPGGAIWTGLECQCWDGCHPHHRTPRVEINKKCWVLINPMHINIPSHFDGQLTKILADQHVSQEILPAPPPSGRIFPRKKKPTMQICPQGEGGGEVFLGICTPWEAIFLGIWTLQLFFF